MFLSSRQPPSLSFSVSPRLSALFVSRRIKEVFLPFPRAKELGCSFRSRGNGSGLVDSRSNGRVPVAPASKHSPRRLLLPLPRRGRSSIKPQFIGCRWCHGLKFDWDRAIDFQRACPAEFSTPEISIVQRRRGGGWAADIETSVAIKPRFRRC